MKPDVLDFKSKTTPYRVFVPAKLSKTGKRFPKYFKFKKDAEKFASDVDRYGMVAVYPDRPTHGTAAADDHQDLINQILAAIGAVADQRSYLARVLDEIKVRQTLPNGNKTYRQAVEEYHRDARGGRDYRFWRDEYARLRRLYDPFETALMPEISPEAITNFFRTMESGIPGRVRPVNPWTHCKTVFKFFGWATKAQYISTDPTAGLEHFGHCGANKAKYSPETFQRMLNVAAGLEAPQPGGEITNRFRSLLPWFLISGFCGLRTCEVIRSNSARPVIKWSDLMLDRKPFPFVLIRAEVSKRIVKEGGRGGKVGRKRNVKTDYVVEALKAWVPYCEQTSEFLMPQDVSVVLRLKKEFTKATGIRFPANGFRNSFSQYWAAFEGDEETTVGVLSRQMGNSEKICKGFYFEEIDPGEGNKWFSIRPRVTPANVMAIAA